MSTQLMQSHNKIGYVIANIETEDGTQLTVLQTNPHTHDVIPADSVHRVSKRDVEFAATTHLIDAIVRLRFLGLDLDAIQGIFKGALAIAESHEKEL